MRLRTLTGFALIVVILTVGVSRFNTHPVNLPTAPQPPPIAPTERFADAPDAATFPVTLADGWNRAVTIPAPPRRIVSLAPGVTELLFDLGAGQRVVGDTTACDYPPEAAKAPHIGGWSDMSVESILARSPDLIVADGSINEKIIPQLTAANAPVCVVQARTLAEAYSTIRLLGRATGETTAAYQIALDMRRRFESVAQVVRAAASKPTVLIMYDTEIHTTGPGSFIDDLVRVAGGVNIARSNLMSPEQVLLDQPDVIICDDSLREKVKQMPGWADAVPAVRNTSFFAPSADATLARPTPRLAKAVEELARSLHPDLFNADGTPRLIRGAQQVPAAGR